MLLARFQKEKNLINILSIQYRIVIVWEKIYPAACVQ